MRIVDLPVEGARRIEPDFHRDDRGGFARAWCRKEFSEAGIELDFVQANVARTAEAGVVRGLHYQVEPHAEAKLLRCTRGAVFDVIVDVRPDSETYLEWVGVELDAEGASQVLVPAGCAHGYQTLREDCEVFYLVSAYYAPEAERGIRWDDPAFGVDWPRAATSVSPKDRGWPPFRAEESRASGAGGGS